MALKHLFSIWLQLFFFFKERKPIKTFFCIFFVLLWPLIDCMVKRGRESGNDTGYPT